MWNSWREAKGKQREENKMEGRSKNREDCEVSEAPAGRPIFSSYGKDRFFKCGVPVSFLAINSLNT